MNMTVGNFTTERQRYLLLLKVVQLDVGISRAALAQTQDLTTGKHLEGATAA